MILIKNFNVSIEGKEILKNISLRIKKGEIHILIGPNGAGKTTLAMALMGNRKFKVKGEKFEIYKKEIMTLSPDERARAGLFVSFQTPIEIPGLSVLSFLRAFYNSFYPGKKSSLLEFKNKILAIFKKVGLDESFVLRYVNQDFSGGEKKKFEIAQLTLIKPKFAILDEIDSGLDVDSLKKVSKIIKERAEENKTAMLVITHYPKTAKYLSPNFVHILNNGKIKTHKADILEKIEKEGYE